MALKVDKFLSQLDFAGQLKFKYLNESDRIKILNSNSIDEASAMLMNMKMGVRLKVGSYVPKIQVSGSSVEYKTKNLFTEIFEEEDVKHFMTLAEMSAMMDDEIITGELKRKISAMDKDGKQPLQCLVYATKHNEKVFYNNAKKVEVWAKIIADFVNSNPDYVISINHMLVNWSMWKYQIIMLINACGYMKQNDKLDGVIRDLYLDYDDDKVRYTVFKRLLRGLNEANYRCAFYMLKKADFILSDIDRKYFGALRRKVEVSSLEELETLYSAFRGVQGFSGSKRKKIESLFGKNEETGIVKKINESAADQKEQILKEVHAIIYGSPSEYREIAMQAKKIRQYRSEIQAMFMHKLEDTSVGYEDVRFYGLAIGNLDQDNKAIEFLEEQMSHCNDIGKELMFTYVLAVLSDMHTSSFIDKYLHFSEKGDQSLLLYVRPQLLISKNQIVRQCLYTNCLKIKEEKGDDSREFKLALRNLGIFFQGLSTIAVYDVKFDQMLFDFIGYNKIDGTFEKNKCSGRNVSLLLGILVNIMDKNNYEGRYMKFMGDLFSYLKNSEPDLAKRVDNAVKDLTGLGIPSI